MSRRTRNRIFTRSQGGAAPRYYARFADYADVGALKADGGRPLGPGSVRQHLNSLSNLFNRALEEGLVTRNPVAVMSEKPKGKPGETRWLEVPDAALLLEAARTYTPKRPDLAA